MASLDLEFVTEFKRLYEKHFNEAISDEKAVELASNLMNLFRVVYGHKSVTNDRQNDVPSTKNK